MSVEEERAKTRERGDKRTTDTSAGRHVRVSGRKEQLLEAFEAETKYIRELVS